MAPPDLFKVAPTLPLASNVSQSFHQAEGSHERLLIASTQLLRCLRNSVQAQHKTGRYIWFPFPIRLSLRNLLCTTPCPRGGELQHKQLCGSAAAELVEAHTITIAGSNPWSGLSQTAATTGPELPPPLPTSLLRGFSTSATTRLQTATRRKEASFKALGQEEETGWVTQSPECLTPVASLCQQNSICFPCCVDQHGFLLKQLVES